MLSKTRDPARPILFPCGAELSAEQRPTGLPSGAGPIELAFSQRRPDDVTIFDARLANCSKDTARENAMQGESQWFLPGRRQLPPGGGNSVLDFFSSPVP